VDGAGEGAESPEDGGENGVPTAIASCVLVYGLLKRYSPRSCCERCGERLRSISNWGMTKAVEV